MNEDVIQRIRTIIKHYDLSVSSFADKIGVQRSSISHLLNGRNKPSLDFVLKVIHTYPEVNLYWLLNGKGEFPSKENPDRSPAASSNTTNTGAGSSYEDVPQQVPKSSTVKEPIRIVIFYTDGTFDSFDAKK
ncbi:DNA-binding transcriptional regulator, XRE-family HTH domain [Flagellimonas pacifica]|uniref:DNA-binding transcriptional regulator, XRE-family HTH domain n=1 Tax=Flagellimonas pacifica TaxID=1247520 RepID=A0A285MRP9_9FLAO|nr:helix-turn-helix transcriptional regulator [Allomuricauda parva]SNY99835.1 DNA-binding transcriptional regulator, XRE-family HTH domain [Allomuricauda parva]